MKTSSFVGLLVGFCCAYVSASAQETTYIFFRHAEKEMTSPNVTTMDADPPLSEKGIARAATIPLTLKKYNPQRIYTTNFRRTRATITPLATKYHILPAIYDPKQLKQFADTLTSSDLIGRTIVIVGHSNTNYKLINVMMGEDMLLPLSDSVYNKYWILIRKKNGRNILREKTF